MEIKWVSKSKTPRVDLKYFTFAMITLHNGLSPCLGVDWLRPGSMRGPFGVCSGFVCDPFRVRSESFGSPFGVCSGSVRNPFGFWSGSVWDQFGIRSGFGRVGLDRSRLDEIGSPLDCLRVELGREGFGSVRTDERINIEPVPVPVSVPAPDFNIDDC